MTFSHWSDHARCDRVLGIQVCRISLSMHQWGTIKWMHNLYKLHPNSECSIIIYKYYVLACSWIIIPVRYSRRRMFCSGRSCLADLNICYTFWVRWLFMVFYKTCRCIIWKKGHHLGLCAPLHPYRYYIITNVIIVHIYRSRDIAGLLISFPPTLFLHWKWEHNYKMEYSVIVFSAFLIKYIILNNVLLFLFFKCIIVQFQIVLKSGIDLQNLFRTLCMVSSHDKTRKDCINIYK